MTLIASLIAAPVLFGEEPSSTPKVITPTAGAAVDTGRAVPLTVSPNTMIVDAIGAMPQEGGYRANIIAVTALRQSIQALNSRLVLEPGRAMPSFCSGATYLVFLRVLDQLQRAGRLAMDEATLRALLVQEHQADGAGVWGRWNANGPGTARLFYEAGLGRNFASFDEAQPGDFMKVFWNNEIGALEAGHSVVYLDTVMKPEGQFVRFWSSNQPNGFGIKDVPRQKIRRALFSRLERPEEIRRVTTLPAKDTYLAAMLKRSSNVEEVGRMVGLSEAEQTRLAAPPPAAASTTPVDHLASTSTATPVPKATPTASPTPAKGWLSRLLKGK